MTYSSVSAPLDSAVPAYIPTHPFWRILVTALVIFHIVGTLVWNMPASYVQSNLHMRYYRYMIYAGFDQGWGMFAPEPGHENFYSAARITYADGHQRLWYIGRQDNLGIWDRLVNERARKLSEQLYDPNIGAPYYPQIALWAARRNSDTPGNPPVKVELMRFWCAIPPPPEGIDRPVVSKWQSDVVYSTTINASGRR